MLSSACFPTHTEIFQKIGTGKPHSSPAKKVVLNRIHLLCEPRKKSAIGESDRQQG